MAKRIKRKFLQILWNPSGQMAIFMILLFQIIFVFFAMLINIGLVINDKINLQNAVDLAAYYGAQRQAEILSAIAHSNYQIRQSLKLLAFRSRVLGTTGVTSGPLRSGSPQEIPWNDIPAICVTARPFWRQGPPNQNLCRNTFNTIPPLPRINQVFAGAIGFGAIVSSNNQLINAYNGACSSHGGRNWFFAMRALTAFRYDQANRKAIIWALGNNLMKRDFIELSGFPVSQGVKKTLMKNLTFQNRGQGDNPPGGSAQNVQFDFINSMALTGLTESKEWLPPIHIDPTLLYSDVDNPPACNSNIKSPLITGAANTGLPSRPFNDAFSFIIGNPTLNQEFSVLQAFAQSSPNDVNILSMTMGVEKNPWYMAYFGVRARTAPRQIFFPFGPTISLQARGFAKPFGGRIGPWYANQWPASNQKSTGQDVDPLAPKRSSPFMNSGCVDATDSCRRIVNYSRFPGDTLGLKSYLSFFATSLDAPGSSPPLRNIGDFNFYNNIVQDFNQANDNQPNDILAWNAFNPTDFAANALRDQEISAIQPDLFDVTYYSIQPHYGDLMLPMLRANRTALGIPGNVAIRGDLGSRGDDPNLRAFNVANQIQKGRINLKTALVFYAIKSKAHLLTDWVSKGVMDYAFPDNAFGKCGPDNNVEEYFDTGKNPKVHGGCIIGGRTGYSVKIVSRDYLLSDGLQLGGQGLTGPILNPLPPGSGW